MTSCFAGYVVVVADRTTPLRGVRLHLTRHTPGQWLARVRRLRRGGLVAGRLRLRDARYVENVAAARAVLEAELGAEFALTGRAPRRRVWRVLAELEALDRKNRAARFDPATRLMRTPGGRLPRPVAVLADSLAAQLRAAAPEGSGRLALLIRPYGLGLAWALLKAETKARGLPGIYVPELFRALVRRLANRHLSDNEIAPLLSVVAEPGAEFRIAAWEDAYFARRPSSHAAPPARAARLGFYLAEPRDSIERGIAHYRRRTRAVVPVRVARWGLRFIQVSCAAAIALGAGALFAQGAAGLLPGLLVLFASVAAVSAWRLYRMPDFAAAMGCIPLQELNRLQQDLKDLHPFTLTSISRPAAPSIPSPPAVSASEPAGPPKDGPTKPRRPAPPAVPAPRQSPRRAPSRSFAPSAPQTPPTQVRHATPLDPVLPSAAFWGVDTAGLPAIPADIDKRE